MYDTKSARCRACARVHGVRQHGPSDARRWARRQGGPLVPQRTTRSLSARAPFCSPHSFHIYPVAPSGQPWMQGSALGPACASPGPHLSLPTWRVACSVFPTALPLSARALAGSLPTTTSIPILGAPWLAHFLGLRLSGDVWGRGTT